MFSLGSVSTAPREDSHRPGKVLLQSLPQEAQGAALLPGNLKGTTSSAQGPAGEVPGRPYSIRNCITFEIYNLPEVYTFFPSLGIRQDFHRKSFYFSW